MKKRLYILIGMLVLAFQGNAQEFRLSPYSHYLTENPFVISPAYAGLEEVHKLRLSGVSQWLGMNGPSEQILSYDTQFSTNSGVGVLLYNDKNGDVKQLGAQLTYAHHLIIDRFTSQSISLGISYKFNHFKIDASNFDVGDGSGHDDPDVGTGISSANHNFGFGALYKNHNFFISFNIPNILNKSAKDFYKDEPTILRNYYIYTGYTFKGGRNGYEFEPSLFYKYFESDGRSITDLNVKVRKLIDKRDYLWAGLSARFINDQGFKPASLLPLVGFNKKRYFLAYGFQWNINESRVLNTYGTHMITLGYNYMIGCSKCYWY